MILYGRVSQWSGTAEGDSLRPVNAIAQLHAGDAFGQEWTCEDAPRPYSVVVEEATVLVAVRRTHFYGVEQSVFRDILNERTDLLCRIPQFRGTRLRRVRDAAAAIGVLEYKVGQALMVQGGGCARDETPACLRADRLRTRSRTALLVSHAEYGAPFSECAGRRT